MKKRFLELLIRSIGLTPVDIKTYRTDGCEGAFEVKTGWEGRAVDKDGEEAFEFMCSGGFNEAVSDILQFIQEFHSELSVDTDWDFKV